MAEDAKEKPQQLETKPRQAASALVFISHDSRDGKIAEAFSLLLRRVSAGMLKTFRSSDKKGTEGIEFGDEWYKRLMSKLETASDVVCLFTERSLERPWILYEAGVAKGKLNRPVLGIALGIPLSKVGTGPFYQFQNSDDSEESLVKLVMQLARRIPALEPDPDVVKVQVKAFKTTSDKLIADLRQPGQLEEEAPTEASTARVLEELKAIIRRLPSRVEKQLRGSSVGDAHRKIHRFRPGMIDELLHMLPDGPSDPIGILVVTSIFRDEAPWLYEVGREAYEAFIGRNRSRRERAARALRTAFEMTRHGPWRNELTAGSEEVDMMMGESMMFIDHMLHSLLETSVEP